MALPAMRTSSALFGSQVDQAVNVARAIVRQLRSDDDATVTREIRSEIRALGIQFPAPRRAAFADGSRANPHILPDKPEADLRTSFGATNPGKDYDDYKVRLGNLTLLEKPINIVASNGFFDRKKPEYVKSGNYLTRSIVGLTEVGKNSSITRINGKLRAFDHWSAQEIERRQEMLITLARVVWRTTPIDAG
jgi:hypothetical protein